MWAFGCQFGFAKQCTDWIVDVYRASAWCFLTASSFPATFCSFPFSFYALACGCNHKTVSLNWSSRICGVQLAQCDGDFIVCSCSQIINEEKEGDGSLHEGTKWVSPYTFCLFLNNRDAAKILCVILMLYWYWSSVSWLGKAKYGSDPVKL